MGYSVITNIKGQIGPASTIPGPTGATGPASTYLGAPVFPAWISGRYYGFFMGTTTGVAAAGGWRYFQPLYVPGTKTFDRIAIRTTTASSAGAVARLGVYSADSSTGLPSALLLDAGTVTTDVLGVREITISASFSGLIWMVCSTPGTGSLTMQTASGTSPTPPYYGAVAPGDGANPCNLLRVAGDTASFETTITATFVLGTAYCPVIYLRKT